MNVIQNKQNIQIIQKSQEGVYKIQDIFKNIKILTYGELYKLLYYKKSLIVVGTNEYDKIEYSKQNIKKSIHKISIIKKEIKSFFPGIFFKINTRIENDFLWAQKLYPDEIIKGQINDKLYKYLYYFINPNKKIKYEMIDINKLDILPSKKKREFKKLETIYQKPYFKKTERYDFYKMLQKKSTQNIGDLKRILIICGLEAYIKKETTEWIKKLFPNNKLEIINTGEDGEYYFMLGESHWPLDIKGEFDLIVFEYCPKNIFYYNNFVFINSKLRKDGYVLFLPIEQYGLYNKTQFEKEYLNYN
jgi:hypothetical protein